MVSTETVTGTINIYDSRITYYSTTDCSGSKYLYGTNSSALKVLIPKALITASITIPEGATNIKYKFKISGKYLGYNPYSISDCVYYSTTSYTSAMNVYSDTTSIGSGSVSTYSSSSVTIVTTSEITSLPTNLKIFTNGPSSYGGYTIICLDEVRVTATYTPAQDTHGYYKVSSSSSYTEIDSGDRITAYNPCTLNLKYTDNYGSSSHTLKTRRKLSSETTWEDVSSTSSSTETTWLGDTILSVSDAGNTYNYEMGYVVSQSFTSDIAFTISLSSPTRTYKWKKSSDTSYSDATSGSTYDANVGTNDGISINLKYTDTYGSSSYELGIVVDGSIPEGYTSTSTSIEKTYKFTTNGNHTISYVYSTDDWTTQTVLCSFTITTRGIVTGDGRLYVGGELVYNSTKELAQYDDTSVEVSGLTGTTVGNITYSWSVGGSGVTSSDYSLTTTSSSVGSCSIKLYTTSKNYTITCTVYSYSVSVKEITFGTGSISCKGKTVAIIREMTPEEGDTSTVFTISAYSYYPTIDSEIGLSPVWSIKDRNGNVLSSSTDYSLSYTQVGINVTATLQMNVTGNGFVLYLTTESHSTLELGTSTYGFNIANIVQMYFPTTTRYSIVLCNDTYSCVLSRRDADTIFDSLEFSSGLNKIGSASFNVIGGNNLTCGGATGNASSLLNNGTKVYIIDNLVPVWSGIITEVDPYNINFYNAVVNTSMLTIKCEESLRELSYVYTSSDTYDGSLYTIITDLLPSGNIGDVSRSTVNYSMSFDVSSVLSAMDSISNQVGWRYRCRPKVKNYGNNFTKSGTIYTVDSSTNISVGDYLVIYDGQETSTTNYYEEGKYYVGKIASISSGTVTFDKYDSLPADGEYKFTVFKGFYVDFKPAYYQDYVPLSVKINDTAQNVSDVSVSSDKFGEISVYGVGNSGETITSTMKAWMNINKDYTIPYSARICESYDSTIDTISMNKQYILGDYTWSEFSVVLNGWSFPIDSSFAFSTYKPTIFYLTNSGKVKKMYLTTNSGTISTTDISRYTDQTGMKKTSVTCAYRVAMSDGTTIPSTDTNYRNAYDDISTSTYTDTEIRLFADVLSSLSSQTNVIFNVVKVSSDYPLNTIIPTNNYIRIGDTRVTCVSVSDSTGMLVFNWLANTIPHGHLTDILVIDDSGIKYTPANHNYDTPTPNSPASKYPDVKKTIQGAEGYSAMELERLACRYMQYGSNYDSRCTADIVYNVFVKSDYVVGCKRILSVGDRIRFEKASSSSGGFVTYDLSNFELVSFTVNLSKNTVSIEFGMPFIEIGDVLYNMLSNSGMSIIPATNSTGS